MRMSLILQLSWLFQEHTWHLVVYSQQDISLFPFRLLLWTYWTCFLLCIHYIKNDLELCLSCLCFSTTPCLGSYRTYIQVGITLHLCSSLQTLWYVSWWDFQVGNFDDLDITAQNKLYEMSDDWHELSSLL